jgi:hypothetical protein
MAFLDNSGDIILDAVLTDLGRERLARGDGSFNIRKFALGDDEIDYALYRNANSSLGAHPSGSAYYDIQIMQTPVLEGFSDNGASMKSKLLSVPRTNILYLPVMQLATGSTTSGVPLYSSTYVIAVDENTQGPTTTNALDMGTSGFLNGASGFRDDNPITVDQGLNTTEISNEVALDSDLVETQYLIEMDNRFGYLIDERGNPAALSFLDDDNIATYNVTVGPDDNFFQSGYADNTRIASPISGPRGTRLVFKIHSSVDLATSTTLFTRLGGTISTLPAAAGGTVSNVKFIDSNVRISGVTTGYRLNVPVRFVKSP